MNATITPSAAPKQRPNILSSIVQTIAQTPFSAERDRAAAAVAFADMLTNIGATIDHAKFIEACGVSELPSIEPCPLSERELSVLRGLAAGQKYKQIATDLALSASTVRSHLHNIYGKLSVLDRAQAVLKATENNWL